MQINISTMTSMAAGLILALVAATAFAEGPMPPPNGPGAMMGGPGGPGAMHCERDRGPMHRYDGWGGREDGWRGPMKHQRGMDRMMRGLHMLHRLNLSQDQRDKVSAILHKAQMENWKTRGEIMDAQYKMRVLYRADQPDPRKVGDVYSQIAKYKREILETHVRAHNEIWNLLTKEQQEQVHNWKQGHWQKRMHGQRPGQGMSKPGMP